jgi:two-component sensor histidine kinase/tetratricopeptide (TPR) repeat protein
MRKIILFIFLWFAGIFMVKAQTNCNCSIENLQQFDSLSEASDSIVAFQMINSLKQNNNKNCVVRGYNMQIEYLLRRPATRSIALPIILEQEKYINQLPCKQELMTFNYIHYARYYRYKGDDENFSKFIFKALANAEEKKDTENELRALINIVRLFNNQKQFDKSTKYLDRAEKIILTDKPDYRTAAHFYWLGQQYQFRFSREKRMSLIDSSFIFADKAREFGLKFKDYSQVGLAFWLFESHAVIHKDLHKAIAYLDSALVYLKKTGVIQNFGSVYVAKAWHHVKLNEKTEAMRWMDTCLFYTEKYEHGTAGSMEVYHEATRLFDSCGNLQRSFALFKTYEHLKDSIFKVQRTEKINELEQKYGKAKNEKTIKELAQQKSIYLLLALAGLLAVAAIAFFLRQQSLKHKKNILETEQRLNRARMNPHFFFNALTTLQKFALQDNDGQAMASNLSKFSNIMRETLESTYKEYVTIEQEMDFLNEYLEVQKIRFPQTFSYEVMADKELEIDELQIPAMIIQPFVENSIEHGFVGVDYAGKIAVHFAKDNKELLIQITDNGKGLTTTAKENNEHISRASQIIKDRIYLLNIKLKTKAGFSIDNNSTGNGVIVKIHLPLLYKSQTNT